jgi:cell division protein YceG involved in septum cleavage
MATSTQVTAGTNATSDQYNNLRVDAIARTHIYKFEVLGNLATGDNQGGSYLINGSETVTKIKHKIATGTSCQFTVKIDATTVKQDTATTTAEDETSITSASLTNNQLLTLNIDSVTGSPTKLVVEVVTSYNI